MIKLNKNYFNLYMLYCRAQVEERKTELEKLERKIFPPRQRATHQDSIPSSSEEQRLGDNGSSDSQEITDMPYFKLKQVTGNDCMNKIVRKSCRYYRVEENDWGVCLSFLK